MKPAIIVDLDGTLADIDHRLALYHKKPEGTDWERFYAAIPDDRVNLWCLALIKSMQHAGHHLLFVTGREGTDQVMKDTMGWLHNKAHLKNDGMVHVFYRKPKDYRPATDIKREIYEQIRHKYEIAFAIDDMPEIAQLWNELGVKCLYCGRMIK